MKYYIINKIIQEVFALKIENIDGQSIYNFFISGANNLIFNEHNLNKINVFPVADGDTGTNLALTMKSIVTKSVKYDHFNKSVTSISETAIENAYGNSGIIFAQYLNGFAIESKDKESLTVSEFIEIAGKAAAYAYDAVVNPKEGTILSVMKDWTSELRSHLNLADFDKMFELSVQKAKILVEETKYKMKVFLDNDVVDAGAKGFLLFLEGILEYIKNGRTPVSANAEDFKPEEHIHIITDTEVNANRYCSQFYIETDKKPDFFKNELKSLGDSLVVTGAEKRLKIHIHTDHPEQVTAVLIKEESILSQKVEDMKLAADIIHRRKNKIGIVTDSIADLPQSFIDDEQITVVPVNLICDTHVYLDKITMKPSQFYENLKNYRMNPTSAQPTAAVLEKTFSDLLRYFDSVIGIFVSAEMSGTYKNAKRAAESAAKKGGKITVIDSKLNSSAEGLLVMKAAELIGQGLSHEDTADMLLNVIKNIHIYVSINDLSSMVKGGRISRTQGYILSKIHLKPVISINESGKGVICEKTFSRKSAVKKILKKMKEDMNLQGIEKYAVVYSDSKSDVSGFTDELIKLTGKQPAFCEPISPVIGLNSGPGAFAAAYIKSGI